MSASISACSRLMTGESKYPLSRVGTRPKEERLLDRPILSVGREWVRRIRRSGCVILVGLLIDSEMRTIQCESQNKSSKNEAKMGFVAKR